ncbi:molybdenum cofactor guanylyltransferase [Flavobacterium frigidarium]|uniref:molybdenum cofactor guanylyltransferase n=1 Tax=Flavobacterium frigidarium TaxID=99286 RepID=UPI00040227EE|nr:molybdenum cofactor guanylyltransferase [Flavobacterium frigidarium]
MNGVSIAILCGGKSSRMQSEKGLVLYNGIPFIEHIIAAAKEVSTDIILITNSSDYDYLPFEKRKDIEIDKGPLGGIYTALTYAKHQNCLILSCDIPLIKASLLKLLFENENVTATVFKDTDRTHPLIGCYSKKVMTKLKVAIENDELKMMRFLDSVEAEFITIDDHRSEQFRNINTVAALNELTNK